MKLIWLMYQLRAKQAWRYWGELGLLRQLAALLAAVAVFFQLYGPVSRSWALAAGLAVLAGFGLATFHRSRPDRPLIEALGAEFWQICLAEYALFLSPVAALLLLSPQPLLVLVWPVILLIISKLPIESKSRTSTGFRWPLLPPAAFEWKSGLRQDAPSLLLLYAGAWVAAPWLPYLPPVLFLLMALRITGFYTFCEPLLMLEATAPTPTGVLWKKWRHCLLFWGGAMLPNALFSAVWYWGEWHWWALWGYLVLTSAVVLTFSVAFKYALYRPSTQLSVNSLLVSLLTLSMLFPISSPLALVVTVRYWFKAKQQLATWMP